MVAIDPHDFVREGPDTASEQLPAAEANQQAAVVGFRQDSLNKEQVAAIPRAGRVDTFVVMATCSFQTCLVENPYDPPLAGFASAAGNCSEAVSRSFAD